MSNSRDIVVSTFSRFSYQILSIVTIFFLTPFTIKTLGDYNYGIWVLVNIFVTYCSYTELGINSAVERELAVATGKNDKEEFNRVFSAGIFLNVITFIVITIISALFAFICHIMKFKDYSIISYIGFLMGISLGVNFLFRCFSSILSANIRFDLISIVNTVQLIIQTSLTIYFLITSPSLVSLTYALLISTIASGFLFLFYAKKVTVFALDIKLINKNIIKKLFNYSGKTFLAQIAEIFRSKLDELVTAAFISVNMVTTYSIANKLNGVVNNIRVSSVSVFTSFLSKVFAIKNKQERVELFFFLSKPMLAVSFICFFGFFFLAKSFIELWVGKSYSIAYYPTIILGLGYFIGYIQAIGVSYMYASATHHYFGVMSIAEGILNFIFSIIFVTVFKLGIIGVALGTLVSMLISRVIAQPIIVSRILEIKTLDYYKFFIVNSVKGLLLYGITGFIIKKITINSYLEILYLSLFLLIVSVLHFVMMLTPKELNFFKQKISSYSITNLKFGFKKI
jgi:O-antigen/teichoic acid export membrane protein